MPDYSLNDKIRLTGAFWVPGDKKHLFTAEVRSTANKHFLYESPKYRRLRESDLSSFVDEMNSREIKTRDVLLGQTDKRDCTLMHLQKAGARGVTNLADNFVVGGADWRVSTLVMGMHLKSGNDRVLDGFALYLSDLDRWIAPPWQQSISSENQTYEFPNKLHTFFSFFDLCSQAEVSLQGHMSHRQTRSKIIGKPVIRVHVKSASRVSLEQVVAQVPRISSFFTLLLGTSVTVTKVQLFRGDEDAYVIRASRLKKEKPNLQSWVRCDASQIALALEKWLAVPASEQMLERSVLGMLRVSRLYNETEFLSLAQALEAFGRLNFREPVIPQAVFREKLCLVRQAAQTIWDSPDMTKRCMDGLININEPTFAERINRTLDMISPELLQKIVGEKEAFAKSIRQTRNYYTHLGIKKTGLVVTGGKELFLLNQKIHALLRAVMLLSLSLSESAFGEAVVFDSKKWF